MGERDMTWWLWALITWPVVAVVSGLLLGRSLRYGMGVEVESCPTVMGTSSVPSGHPAQAAEPGGEEHKATLARVEAA
jgi:hypothetical protein